MAENHPSSVTGTQQHRPDRSLVLALRKLPADKLEDAYDLVARFTARIVVENGEDDLIVSMFDHGGSGGATRTPRGTGKLYFGIHEGQETSAIHNRRPIIPRCHGTRDIWVRELTMPTRTPVGHNSWHGAETRWNARRTTTLNHRVPTFRGIKQSRKEELMPD